MTEILRPAMYLQDKHSLREEMEFAKYAEKAGFEAVWFAESRLAREATVPMSAIAAVTEKIKVGSGVINNWTRNVGLCAATFSTLDQLAPGRVICGLGAWWDPLASQVGVKRRKPLLAMREYLETMRKLLAMETVTFKGEFVDVKDINLDIVHGSRKAIDVPLYIGATGPKMLELSGEISDGVLLNYLVSTEYNQRALVSIKKGADLAGRKMDDIDRPQLVVCSLDEDGDRAIWNAKKLVTQYLAQQPHFGKAIGLKQDLLDEIRSIVSWPATSEDIEKAMPLVEDSVVQNIAAAGTPDECRAKVIEYIENGCTSPVLYPLGDDVKAMIDTFRLD